MGLFEDLGKKVERFKQQASEAASEDAAYVCGDCGESIYVETERCPYCGSEDLLTRADAE